MNIQTLVVMLDVALTGKTLEEALHTRHVKPDAFHKDPEDWFYFGGIYYLTDGGYSRVFYSDMTEELCLASESRNEVKERWGECPVVAAVRAEIERCVREWYGRGLGG